MESEFMNNFEDKSELIEQESLGFTDSHQSALLNARIDHILSSVEMKIGEDVQDSADTYKLIESGISDIIQDMSKDPPGYFSPELNPKLPTGEALFSAKKKKKTKKPSLRKLQTDDSKKPSKKKENLVKSLKEEFSSQVSGDKDNLSCSLRIEAKLIEQKLRNLQNEINLKSEEICSKNIELYKKDIEILDLKAQLTSPKKKSVSETSSVSIYSTISNENNPKEKLLEETLENKTKHIESLIEQNSLLQLEIAFLSEKRDPTQAHKEIWELTRENNKLHKQIYDLETVEMLQIKIISLNTIEKLEEKAEKYKEKLLQFQEVQKNLSVESERKMDELKDEISKQKTEIKAFKEAIEAAESVSDEDYIVKYFEFNGLEWVFVTNGETGKWIHKHKIKRQLVEKLEEDFENSNFKELYEGYHYYRQQIQDIKEMISTETSLEDLIRLVNRLSEQPPNKEFDEVSLVKDLIRIQKENNELEKQVRRMDEVLSSKAQNIYNLKCEIEKNNQYIENVKYANILLKKLKISLVEASSQECLNLIEGVQSILER